MVRDSGLQGAAGSRTFLFGRHRRSGVALTETGWPSLRIANAVRRPTLFQEALCPHCLGVQLSAPALTYKKKSCREMTPGSLDSDGLQLCFDYEPLRCSSKNSSAVDWVRFISSPPQPWPAPRMISMRPGMPALVRAEASSRTWS